MKFKYLDVEILFEMMSASPYGDAQGYLCPETGTTHFHTDFGDNFEELPDDIDDNDKYIRLPHKNDLDLGNNLVFTFVAKTIPDDYDKVRDIFRKRGAHSHYKSLLAHKGLLEQWHNFQNGATERGLREWLEEEGVELID